MMNLLRAWKFKLIYMSKDGSPLFECKFKTLRDCYSDIISLYRSDTWNLKAVSRAVIYEKMNAIDGEFIALHSISTDEASLMSHRDLYR